MTEDYLKEFERWVAGPKERKARLRAELEEHLRAAEAAGDVDALSRMGTPREAAKTFSEGHELSTAPLPRRIGAALADIAVTVALLLAGTSLGTWSGSIGRDWSAVKVRGNYEPFWEMGVAAALLIIAAGLWWVVVLPLLEWRYGQTFGKRLFSIRVVSEDGAAPKFGQILLRRLTMIFSGPLQIIDWAFMFFTAKHQRAFELVAKTVVVKDEETTPERLEPAAAT